MAVFASDHEKSVAGKCSSGGGGGSNLNPHAREWNFASDRAPEEDRSLYLTFSRRRPLQVYEIFQFFNQKYDPCVERVYMKHRNGRSDFSKWAKVVFCFSHIPLAVLGKEDIAKFVVNSRTMWCKKYKPTGNSY